jgi:hypothetical protein
MGSGSFLMGRLVAMMIIILHLILSLSFIVTIFAVKAEIISCPG